MIRGKREEERAVVLDDALEQQLGQPPRDGRELGVPRARLRVPEEDKGSAEALAAQRDGREGEGRGCRLAGSALFLFP